MKTRIAELQQRGKQVLHEEGFLSFLKKALLYFGSLIIRALRKVIFKSTSGKVCQPYNIAHLKKGTKYYEIAQLVYKERLDTGVQLSENDANALEKLVSMILKEGIKIVEVGSWKGISTSVLAKTVENYNGKVFAVDHWQGSEGTWLKEEAQVCDVYLIFKRNMIALGVWGVVQPLVMDSLVASKEFTNGALDLVFIDADHRYESVKKDILAWLPKVKDGGIICGHDSEGYYTQYPEETRKLIDENLSIEYLPCNNYHPGVIRALHDIFQDRYSIVPGSSIWYKQKSIV